MMEVGRGEGGRSAGDGDRKVGGGMEGSSGRCREPGGVKGCSARLLLALSRLQAEFCP